MTKNTDLSRAWRNAMRAEGYVPKLIWVKPAHWPKVQALIKKLKG